MMPFKYSSLRMNVISSMWSHVLPSGDLCSGNWNVASVFAKRTSQACSLSSFSIPGRSPGSRLSHSAGQMVSLLECMVFADTRSTPGRALKHWSRRLHASRSCNTRTRPRWDSSHHMPAYWDVASPSNLVPSFNILCCIPLMLFQVTLNLGLVCKGQMVHLIKCTEDDVSSMLRSSHFVYPDVVKGMLMLL